MSRVIIAHRGIRFLSRSIMVDLAGRSFLPPFRKKVYPQDIFDLLISLMNRAIVTSRVVRLISLILLSYYLIIIDYGYGVSTHFFHEPPPLSSLAKELALFTFTSPCSCLLSSPFLISVLCFRSGETRLEICLGICLTFNVQRFMPCLYPDSCIDRIGTIDHAL